MACNQSQLRQNTADVGSVQLTKNTRIKEMRIANSKRKKESKGKPKKEFEIIQKGQAAKADRKAKIPDPLAKENTKESVNQTTKPPTFYNNSDFVLGSGGQC